MNITRFEEIEAWKKSRRLTREIYEITATGKFGRDFGLSDQIRRPAVPVMSNIAEGFDRDGNKEFIQFLSVAKGSTSKVKSQLCVALDAGLIIQEEFNRLSGLAEETARLIGGFIRYLKQSALRGRKTRNSPGRNAQPGTRNQQLGTRNPEPGTQNKQ